MPTIFLLAIISAGFLPEIVRTAGANGSADGGGAGNPMVMVKSTLKTWHTTYNYYREEIGLGYCWADYFLDVKNLLNTLTGSTRLLGINPDDPSPLIAIVKSWSTADAGGGEGEAEKIEDNYRDDYNYRRDRGPRDRNPEKNDGYFYPGSYDFGIKTKDPLTKRGVKSHGITDPAGAKSETRATGDLLISALGFDVTPGLGPLMIGVRGTRPIFVIISQIIGTVMRVGRRVLDTIESTSVLACTKDYLMGKMLRWIDS